jgi:hypothetical protein
MAPINLVKDLVQFLRGATLRTRIGLWRMPLDVLGREADLAVALGVEAVDIRIPLSARLAPGTEFMHLSPVKIVETLDTVASQNGQSDCVLICNLDLLLAAISQQERQQVWRELYDGLPHRPRALLLAIPEQAVHLLPVDEMIDSWRRDRRLAG